MELTLDLQLEILTWIPAHVVLKFRYVSKAWNVAIRSTNFINQHLARSIDSQTDPRRPITFLFVPLSRDLNLTTLMEVDKKEHVSLTLSTIPENWHVVSTCHGLLLCLLQWQYDTCCISIFNPTTNDRLDLPSNSVHLNLTICHVLGFGFINMPRKEYKVVAVARLNDHTRLPSLVVCTVSPHGDLTPWRLLQQPNLSFTFAIGWKPQAMVKGKLHWIMLEHVSTNFEQHPILLSFDLHSEQFDVLSMDRVVPTPWDRSALVLLQLEGCLGLISIWNGEVQVFKLVEYNNCESWTLVFHFYSVMLKPLDMIPDRVAGVSCFLKDGELYVCWGNLLLTCDLKTGKYFITPDFRCHSFGFPSITSLVSLTAPRDSK